MRAGIALLLGACFLLLSAWPVAAQFDNTNILVEEAVNHIYQKRYKSAHQSLQRAYEQSPRHPAVHFNLGRLFELTGNFSEAGKEYQLAATLDPSMVAARRGLARVSVELKRIRGASQVEAMDQALRRPSPPGRPTGTGPGAGSGRRQTAAVIRQNIPAPPTRSSMPSQRYIPPSTRPVSPQEPYAPRITVDNGPSAPARTPTVSLPPMPENPSLSGDIAQPLPPLPAAVAAKLKGVGKSAAEARAEALLDGGNAQESLEILESLLQKDPDNPRLHFLMGRGHALKGELFNAIKRFEQTLRVDEHFHNAYYLLAQNYAKVNLLDDAVRNYLIYFAVKPQAKVALEIARTYEQMGSIAKAEEFYRKANAMNPGNPSVQNRLSNAEADMANDLYLRANHAYTLEQFNDAVNLFQQALETPGLQETYRRDAIRKVEVARFRHKKLEDAKLPAKEGFAATRKIYGTVNLRYPQLANVEFKTKFTGPVSVEWRGYVARAFTRYGRDFLLMIKELSQDELDEMRRDRNDFRLNKHFNNQPVFLLVAQKGQFPPFAREGSFITFTGTTDWRFYDILNDFGSSIKLPSFEYVSAHPSESGNY